MSNTLCNSEPGLRSAQAFGTVGADGHGSGNHDKPRVHSVLFFIAVILGSSPGGNRTPAVMLRAPELCVRRRATAGFHVSELERWVWVDGEGEKGRGKRSVKHFPIGLPRSPSCWGRICS